MRSWQSPPWRPWRPRGAAGSTPGRPGNAPPTASSTPFTLYTHCGIDELRVNGRWYEADPPLSDGNGNPPHGWGNPTQQGLVWSVSDTEVEFTDDAGHDVRFVLRPDATGPRQVCSSTRRQAHRPGGRERQCHTATTAATVATTAATTVTAANSDTASLRRPTETAVAVTPR